MQGGDATFVDSTISSNQAWGGAGFFRDASGLGNAVTFTRSTIAGNIVGAGGGGGATSLQPMIFVNSTVSNNTGTGLSANATDSARGSRSRTRPSSRTAIPTRPTWR